MATPLEEEYCYGARLTHSCGRYRRDLGRCWLCSLSLICRWRSLWWRWHNGGKGSMHLKAIPEFLLKGLWVGVGEKEPGKVTLKAAWWQWLWIWGWEVWSYEMDFVQARCGVIWNFFCCLLVLSLAIWATPARPPINWATNCSPSPAHACLCSYMQFSKCLSHSISVSVINLLSNHANPHLLWMFSSYFYPDIYSLLYLAWLLRCFMCMYCRTAYFSSFPVLPSMGPFPLSV